MFLDKKTVRNLRLKNAWSQQHLADLCGINIRTIQRVEREGSASFDTTMALASVFNLPKEHLLKKIEPLPTNYHTQIFIFLLGVLLGACLAQLFI